MLTSILLPYLLPYWLAFNQSIKLSADVSATWLWYRAAYTVRISDGTGADLRFPRLFACIYPVWPVFAAIATKLFTVCFDFFISTLGVAYWLYQLVIQLISLVVSWICSWYNLPTIFFFIRRDRCGPQIPMVVPASGWGVWGSNPRSQP